MILYLSVYFSELPINIRYIRFLFRLSRACFCGLKATQITHTLPTTIFYAYQGPCIWNFFLFLNSSNLFLPQALCSFYPLCQRYFSLHLHKEPSSHSTILPQEASSFHPFQWSFICPCPLPCYSELCWLPLTLYYLDVYIPWLSFISPKIW